MSDRNGARPATVFALAGRRVDAAGADTPRFPLARVSVVRDRLASLFVGRGAAALVCSAACGADLVALEAAEHIGIRRRIVLPFAPARFRETSVTDRPGDWGPLFDRMIATVRAEGNLVVLAGGEGEGAYSAANGAILREARVLASGTPSGSLLAVTVWEGASRGPGDSTDGFRRLAADAGLEMVSLSTL